MTQHGLGRSRSSPARRKKKKKKKKKRTGGVGEGVRREKQALARTNGPLALREGKKEKGGDKSPGAGLGKEGRKRKRVGLHLPSFTTRWAPPCREGGKEEKRKARGRLLRKKRKEKGNDRPH